MVKTGRHFVLVHGGGHGAWCWYKVATRLQSIGHKVTALDMAASGIHPKQVHETLLLSDYFEPLMEFMASLPLEERVILVGHSKGGLCISAAMERFPNRVSVAIFASALMPSPNLTYETLLQQFKERLKSDMFMDSQFGFHNGLDEPPTSLLAAPKLMASNLYQLSPLEDLTLGLTLIRHDALNNDEESFKAAAVTQEKYGSVRRVYVVSKKDNMMGEEFQRWMIENNPPDEVKLIMDSDHMVMFSKPDEMCSCLQEIADKYA